MSRRVPGRIASRAKIAAGLATAALLVVAGISAHVGNERSVSATPPTGQSAAGPETSGPASSSPSAAGGAARIPLAGERGAGRTLSEQARRSAEVASEPLTPAARASVRFGTRGPPPTAEPLTPPEMRIEVEFASRGGPAPTSEPLVPPERVISAEEFGAERRR